MHQGRQALPRLRPSLAGAHVRHSSSRCRTVCLALLACCGLLLAGGYLATSSLLLRSSSSVSASSSRDSKDYFSSKQDFEPVAAAVAALQRTAARTAAARAAAAAKSAAQQDAGKESGGTVEAMQQLQQGADTALTSIMNMGSTGTGRMLHQQPHSTSSVDSAVAQSQVAGIRFAEVASDIQSSGHALYKQPRVHGYVTKAGIMDVAAWMMNSTDARMENFISWRLNRTRAGGAGPATADSYTCAAADHPKLPFPGCHVFVNHRYKYIYIRSPKAASTSIVNMLGECNNKATKGYNSSSCMVLHFYWNNTMLESENLQRMWKDYFVFGFVRNPWRRAYSLFKYLHSNGCMHDDKLHDPNCRVLWPRFCADPWSAGDELHDKGCIKRSKSYLYFHMLDQFHCMRTAQGQWAVDFIGRVDDPNEDWAEVIKTLNANRVNGVPELPVADLEQKNVRAGNIKDPYLKPGADQCFDSVSRWYACDVQHYGFAALGRAST